MARGILRRWTLGSVLAALATAPVPAAQDREPDARRQAAAAAAAARLSAFGNWCRGRSLRASARARYQEALRLDPEDAAARAGLGHGKGPEGWRPPAKPDDAPDGRLTGTMAVTALARETEAAYREAGQGFAAWAAGLEEEGRAAEAAAAWRQVLWFDPANAGARGALRLEGADGAWIPLPSSGPGAAKERFAALAAKGAARLPPPSDSERHRAWSEDQAPHSESREARFAVKSYLEDAGAREMLDGILRAEALFEGLGVVPPRDGKDDPMTYLLMSSRKAFQDAVRGREGKDDAWRKSHLGLSGFWWTDTTYMKWTGVAATAFDSAVHNASHHVVEEILKPAWSPAWMKEGISHMASTTIRGTGRTWCLSLKGSAFRKDLSEVQDWDEEVREVVRSGVEPSLADLTVAGFNDLSPEGLVKGRSLAAWLLAVAPGSLPRIVEGHRKEMKPEEIWIHALGAPPEAVERRWRCWALLP